MGPTKKNCYRQIWCILLLWIPLCSASAPLNIVAVNTLADGEVETRIRYKKISAKETTVGKGSASGLKYRQILRGNNFLQLIYNNNDTLNDCEFVQDANLSKTFLTNFKQDLSHLSATSNVSIQTLRHNSLPEDVKWWLDMRKLRKECKQLHRRLKTDAEQMKHLRMTNSTRRFANSRNKRSHFIFPGTKWCGLSNNAKKYTELGLLSSTDRCCRHHDRCKKDIPGLSKKYNLLNPNIYTLSHCFCDQRERRDIGDFLRVPGTKWCGKGFSAEKYTRLGMFSRTDRCCRKHDTTCPFWIGGFSTKYGLYNWRINTIMHCGCDERFRACLKLVGSSDANVVGKLFFNVVQSQCFVMKFKKRCIKRSWWGKCEKHKFVKYAILRDNLPY